MVADFRGKVKLNELIFKNLSLFFSSGGFLQRPRARQQLMCLSFKTKNSFHRFFHILLLSFSIVTNLCSLNTPHILIIKTTKK